MTIAWVGLHTVGLLFTSADLQVVALTIAMAALLLRVRAGVARQADYLWLGLALGVAFLAKAATIALFASVLLVLAILLGTSQARMPWRDRRFYRAAGMAALVVLPFRDGALAGEGSFCNQRYGTSELFLAGYRHERGGV